MNEDRCKHTIDLEDFLMTLTPRKPDSECSQIRATITYNSGRTETIHGKLNKDKSPHKTFQQKIDAFRSFPTVVNIKQEKY